MSANVSTKASTKVPTKTELSKWKVAELRARLETLGSDAGGLKKDLVWRLHAQLTAQSARLQQQPSRGGDGATVDGATVDVHVLGQAPTPSPHMVAEIRGAGELLGGAAGNSEQTHDALLLVEGWLNQHLYDRARAS